MFRRPILALALLAMLPGCGALSAITLPEALVQVAAEAPPAAGGDVDASWLGGAERAALERALRRYLERTTPDGRLEVTRVEIEQKLLGARYRFKAVKRVFRPRVTIVHRVTGVYDKREDRIVELREVAIVDPREAEALAAPEAAPAE